MEDVKDPTPANYPGVVIEEMSRGDLRAIIVGHRSTCAPDIAVSCGAKYTLVLMNVNASGVGGTTCGNEIGELRDFGKSFIAADWSPI